MKHQRRLRYSRLNGQSLTLNVAEEAKSKERTGYQSQRKLDSKRVFKDQDESIAHFISQIKRLIHLYD